MALPATHGRVLGQALGRQLFFDVWAMKPSNWGTTFVRGYYSRLLAEAPNGRACWRFSDGTAFAQALESLDKTIGCGRSTDA
jgi:hypothetical protein